MPRRAPARALALLVLCLGAAHGRQTAAALQPSALQLSEDGDDGELSEPLDLMRDNETVAADHELESYLMQEEAKIASEQHMAARLSSDNGYKMPGFEGIVELIGMNDMQKVHAITEGRGPLPPPPPRVAGDIAGQLNTYLGGGSAVEAGRVRAVNEARCPENATDQRTYGVLDMARDDRGGLVLMQGMAPYETRRDLSLANNTACPALQRKCAAAPPAAHPRGAPHLHPPRLTEYPLRARAECASSSCRGWTSTSSCASTRAGAAPTRRPRPTASSPSRRRSRTKSERRLTVVRLYVFLRCLYIR